MTTDLTDAEIEAAAFRADVLFEGNLVRLSELRDFVELLDELPENTLITVQPTGLFYEEPA